MEALKNCRKHALRPKWWMTGLALLAVTAPHAACDDWRCGYGGPGCSDPTMAGLCDEVFVVGQEYIAIFGYGSDTGLSEATVLGVVSDNPDVLAVAPTSGAPDLPYDTGPVGPFDLNNGPGDGGITLRPMAPGQAHVTVQLKGWDETRTMLFNVVDIADAPEGFMAMSAEERRAQCIDITVRVP